MGYVGCHDLLAGSTTILGLFLAQYPNPFGPGRLLNHSAVPVGHGDNSDFLNMSCNSKTDASPRPRLNGRQDAELGLWDARG